MSADPERDTILRELAEADAQIRDLLEEREELLTEIRRLRMSNHPAGRALRSLPPIAPFADALAEALTERDAEHEGGGGAALDAAADELLDRRSAKPESSRDAVVAWLRNRADTLRGDA